MILYAVCVTSCAAGARVSLMARRRTFHGRPHDHLALAAAAHERLATGVPHGEGDTAGGAAQPGEAAKPKRARAQPRDTGGKFK